MQSVSSRIWTRVAVSISYNDNDYTTGTSKMMHVKIFFFLCFKGWNRHKSEKVHKIWFDIFNTENANRVWYLTKFDSFFFLQQGEFQGKKKKEGNLK